MPKVELNIGNSIDAVKKKKLNKNKHKPLTDYRVIIT